MMKHSLLKKNETYLYTFVFLILSSTNSLVLNTPNFFFVCLLYNIVLVLPYINMNPPQVYTCSPSWTHLPPHTIPLGHPSAPALSTLSHLSNLDWWSTCFDNIYVSMPFFQRIPPLPSPTESKRLFYTSVSLLLSRIQGHLYHLSEFHIYVLVYCISVFLFGLLHSIIGSSFIHLIRTDSNVLFLMAE